MNEQKNVLFVKYSVWRQSSTRQQDAKKPFSDKKPNMHAFALTVAKRNDMLTNNIGEFFSSNASSTENVIQMCYTSHLVAIFIKRYHVMDGFRCV